MERKALEYRANENAEFDRVSSSTPVTATELASLVCSRLCHDLLSPVGAISNGLELLADERDPAMRANCIELIEQSARISADKLKFFRLAYGAAGGFGELVQTGEARTLIEALIAGDERLTLDWSVGAPKLPKPAIKLLLNFAQMGLDALVRGGTLTVGAELDGDAEIVVRATGPRIAFDDRIGGALEGELPEDGLSSRTAPAWMLHLIAREAGGGVQFRREEDALLLGAVLPNAAEGMIG